MKKIFFALAIVGLISCNSGNNKTSENSASNAEIVETTINIGGLHCENCVASVTKGINSLEGIEDVIVTLSDSTAVVNFDVSKLELAEIEKAIEKRGYSVKK